MTGPGANTRGWDEARSLTGRHPGRSGVTLVELLIVVGIVGALAGFLVPVYAQARAASREKECTSNLRQIGAAFRMYQQDYDDARPLWLCDVVPAYMPKEMLVCGADPTGNYSYKNWGEGITPRPHWRYPQSYDYFIVPWDVERWRVLEDLGPRAGCILDRLHGTQAPEPNHLTSAPYYLGRTLRLGMDGNVRMLNLQYPNGHHIDVWYAMTYWPGAPAVRDPSRP